MDLHLKDRRFYLIQIRITAPTIKSPEAGMNVRASSPQRPESPRPTFPLFLRTASRNKALMTSSHEEDRSRNS
jgi:hypothetical protein